MKKIIVIGCPGSGKSHFSSRLHKMSGIPLYHLDMMYWNTDKTVVEKALFLERLNGALFSDEWIIDGNYISTMELRLSMCDTVFFLDYPTDVCLCGIRERIGVPRADMPWTEIAEDPEFVEFVKNFRNNTRPRILELMHKYREKKIFVFHEREDEERFLASVKF